MHKFLGAMSMVTALTVTGCATVTESMPTVQIVRQQPKPVATVMAQYEKTTTVQRAEAPMVCDNANMRERAADNNSNNDTARVLILEESDHANTVLADVVVNCKDYFESAGQWQAANWQTGNRGIVTTPAISTATIMEPDAVQPAPQRIINQSSVIQARQGTTPASHKRHYTIRTGDNLYRIARSYCTDTETLASINAIADPTQIKPGQILRLPDTRC